MSGSRPRVLCVDDEPEVLKGLRLTLRRKFEVVTADSGAAGLAAIRDDGPFALLISDMRMPAMHGTGFLSRVKESAPDTVRIVLTGNTQVREAIDAVNEGQIFRFLTKPCPAPRLVDACLAAAEQHRLVTAERVLLQDTLRGCINTLTDLLALTQPAAFGRGNRLKRCVGLLARRLGIGECWELEVAALLSQIACATLPAETAERLYYGRELEPADRPIVARIPETNVQLLGSIPRLDGVRDILIHQNKSFDGSGAGPSSSGEGIPLGARLLRLALDYDSLESQGVEEQDRIEKLAARSGTYDPAVFAALVEIVQDMTIRGRVETVRVAELEPGMILASDALSSAGRLLLARGCEITENVAGRLDHFPRGSICEPIQVLIPEVGETEQA